MSITVKNGDLNVNIAGSPHYQPAKPAPIVVPPLLAVKSSVLAAIGYANGAMFARMANGKVYHYPGVTMDEYAQVQAADSIGRHFSSHIVRKHRGHIVDEAGE